MAPDALDLAVSLPPERLEIAAGRGRGSNSSSAVATNHWSAGNATSVAVLEAVGAAPGRVASGHLPPGLRQQGVTGMTLTRENRSDVLDFVHDQLDEHVRSVRDPLV